MGPCLLLHVKRSGRRPLLRLLRRLGPLQWARPRHPTGMRGSAAPAPTLESDPALSMRLLTLLLCLSTLLIWTLAWRAWTSARTALLDDDAAIEMGVAERTQGIRLEVAAVVAVAVDGTGVGPGLGMDPPARQL